MEHRSFKKIYICARDNNFSEKRDFQSERIFISSLCGFQNGSVYKTFYTSFLHPQPRPKTLITHKRKSPYNVIITKMRTPPIKSFQVQSATLKRVPYLYWLTRCVCRLCAWLTSSYPGSLFVIHFGVGSASSFLN